jgi:Tol biopolymer transport system component
VLAAAPGSSAAAAAPTRGPELVAPGVVSTVDDEFGFVIAPGGGRALFVKRTPTTNSRPRLVVCEVRRTGSGWGAPRVAAFSGRDDDFGLAFAPDGSLYFTSNRPHAGAAAAAGDYDLWVVAPAGDGWGAPRWLGPPIDTPGFEGCPSLAADGTLYFASDRPGGKGNLDLYRARPAGASFAEPENLTEVNTAGSENQPAISPAQDLLVFTGTRRPDALTGGGAPYPRPDLYLARADSGAFRRTVHLEPPINTTAAESNASFSPDGAWLYFASDRGFASIPMSRRVTAAEFERARRSLDNGFNNVYRVPAASLRAARSGR